MRRHDSRRLTRPTPAAALRSGLVFTALGLATLSLGVARPDPASAQAFGQELGKGRVGKVRPSFVKQKPVKTPLPASVTEGPATLIADQVNVQQQSTLVASGHVEVFYHGNQLKAEKVTYDQRAGKLDITGPLTLVDAQGQTTILASSAQLSSDMQNGILESAKMVLGDQVEVAADELNRVDGRYTQLKNTVTSSCEVCAAHPVPLWEVRSRRVIHDEVKHRIYFEGPQFRLAGVPVFYLPRLRLPDPSVKRATGFLVPNFTSSSNFGTGVKLPYFIAMGPSRDLLLEPFLASKNTTSLGFRYRQEFNIGSVEVNGALSRDTILRNQNRGYLFANGTFRLPRDFKLNVQVQTVSDPDYFLNYGLTQIDQLKSGIDITRTRRDEYIDGQLLHFESIRPGDNNDTLPSDAAYVTWVRRFQPALLGGEGSLTFSSGAELRSSSEDIVGRDVDRVGLQLDWRRNWTFGPGVVGSVMGSLTSDFYTIGEDSTYPGNVLRSYPTLGAELRWPLVKSDSLGGSQVLEPVAQLVWSPTNVTAVPNEDSQQSEFDEGDLWSLARFNGRDGVELGARANIGLSYTRFDPAGWSLGVTGGRIFRQHAIQQFDTASGLGGAQSDWLLAVQAKWNGFDLINRAVFGNGRGLSKDELRLAWAGRRFAVGSSYLWMVADNDGTTSSTADDDPTREWIVDAAYPIYRNWSGTASWRYDFVADRADRAALGLNWRNECISVDLSLSRNYASSTNVSPTTTFGFSVGLVGFGGVQGTSNNGTCAR